MSPAHTLLLIGEQAVGKTHYGAQSLKRLMLHAGELRMNGMAANTEPYEDAFNQLSRGLAGTHTPSTVYVESRWPVATADGLSAELIWPDYGGEQVLEIARKRVLDPQWVSRAKGASAWMFMVRPGRTRQEDDLFSRPLEDMTQLTTVPSGAVALSDQARLVELLQLLLYIRGARLDRPLQRPRLTVVLSCWDELIQPGTPPEELEARLPLLSAFVRANWSRDSLDIVGLSALERPLDPKIPDQEFARRGPEAFGYVIDADGNRTSDLLTPLAAALRAVVRT